MAVNAGCRTFILEIDYLDECKGETVKYFPRIVVRDAQNKMRIKYNSNRPICNSPQHSNIRDVCDKINFYAFAPGCQNASDPITIVLYFLRQPPGSYKSKTVLDYYSNVAKALSPFQNRLLQNELDGGTYYRQSQEGRLLINNIKDYSGKVLIFSNANTLGFRETQLYSPNEDLDFLTNLRDLANSKERHVHFSSLAVFLSLAKIPFYLYTIQRFQPFVDKLDYQHKISIESDRYWGYFKDAPVLDVRKLN
jgi:hypothetical protein